MSIRTSPLGDFHFSNLPVGEYSLRVVAPGFTPFSASSIRVDIERVVKLLHRGQIARLNVTERLAPGLDQRPAGNRSWRFGRHGRAQGPMITAMRLK